MAVHTRNGHTVGVHVGVKVHVAGTVAVNDGVSVAVGVTGFNTRPIKLMDPNAISKINAPNPPMMASLSQVGVWVRPPRRRGATLRTTVGAAAPMVCRKCRRFGVGFIVAVFPL